MLHLRLATILKGIMLYVTMKELFLYRTVAEKMPDRWRYSQKSSPLTRSQYVRMYTHTHTHTHTYIYIYIYRVSQEECARLREGVPYVKIYRYNPKHVCPKLNGYGDNGQRSLKL